MRRFTAALLGLIILVACGSSASRADETPTVRSAAEQLASVSDTTRPSTTTLPLTLPDRQFELYTHCGINGAMIDGVWWRSTTALNDGNGNPPPGWGNPYQSGVLHFLDGSAAVFRASDPNLSVKLQRTHGTDPLLCK
jgi:hypothetical protein